jgi:hypothetical protein
LNQIVFGIAAVLFFVPALAFSQVRVSGRVYDASQYRPLQSVSVLSNSSGATETDSLGRYSIVLNENDSIWFSYLGKPTPKYPVKAIQNFQNFEISLHVNVTQLKEVIFRKPSYRFDSIQNRLDYAKAFDFRKPNFESLTSTTSQGGVGLDIQEFIRLFQFRKNRRMLAFQKRLLQEEQDKFIDHRFTRALVTRITHLRAAELDTFMKRYRPYYEFTQTASEYEFQYYIKQAFLHYERYKRLLGDFNKREEE